MKYLFYWYGNYVRLCCLDQERWREIKDKEKSKIERYWDWGRLRDQERDRKRDQEIDQEWEIEWERETEIERLREIKIKRSGERSRSRDQERLK